MKLHYYPETDSLYIALAEGSAEETREVADRFDIDLDDRGRVVGIDGASRKLDLATETINLPLGRLKAA